MAANVAFTHCKTCDQPLLQPKRGRRQSGFCRKCKLLFSDIPPQNPATKLDLAELARVHGVEVWRPLDSGR